MNLTDRTALVTGASQNIGREIAVTLADAGADVGITTRSDKEGAEKTAQLVNETGSQAAVSLGDLADPAAIERVVDDIRDELGPIDILVNNASIRPLKPFQEITLDEWERVHNVDLRAMFLTAQQVIPDMLESETGSIVNILGITVYLGKPQKSHVVANKAGIIGLTRTLAAEFGPDGVRANGLCLGHINTDSKYSEKSDSKGARNTVASSSSALRRVGEPQEVADACCYLASERSSFITGQIIHVNGGLFPTINLGTA